MRWNGIPFEWIAALPLVGFAAGGCCTPGTGRVSAINKEREKEADARAAKELEKTAPAKLTARSQAPTNPIEAPEPGAMRRSGKPSRCTTIHSNR